MGCSKLREWVGTVTGKGDRWGRDRLGRSAPAFLSVSNIALPPPTCTARREAGRRWSAAVVSLRGRPSVAVCFEACAGRRIRWLCLPAVALFCGLCACCHPLPAMPTALLNVLAPVQLLCPHSFALFATFIAMCARIDSSTVCFQSGPAVCKLQDCPVGSCNTGLQWRPVRRVHLTPSFSCRVHDPGPWVSVNF